MDVKHHRDLTAPEPKEKSPVPDDRSDMRGGEGSLGSSRDEGDRREETDHHDSAVLGYLHDDRALLREGGSTPFPRYPRHSQEPAPRLLGLVVTAVKLEHPVSAAQDRKAEEQHVLYRERRSPSPPAGASHAAAQQAGGGRKGLSSSHSDGVLLGGNALIQGTKAKLNATTGRTSVRGTGDDVGDDASAGVDTINSALSPINSAATAGQAGKATGKAVATWSIGPAWRQE